MGDCFALVWGVIEGEEVLIWYQKGMDSTVLALLTLPLFGANASDVARRVKCVLLRVSFCH